MFVFIFEASSYSFAQNRTPAFIKKQLKQKFNIASGSLSTALLSFAAQGKISFFIQQKDTAGKKSPAVQGLMTSKEALILLLQYSDLGFEYINADTVSISSDLPKIKLPAKTVPLQSLKKIPQENQDEKRAIEEVIVTAQRRKRNIQDSPLAVSVISPPAIRQMRLHNIEDISTRIPGLTVSNFSLGQPTLHVRGVGSNDDGAALDNSIVMFIDDVYVGRITAINMNFFDLERIEILRGPQGTLYGKNAIGGAVNITSNSPSEELSGYAEITLGNYNRFDSRAMISGAVFEDKILARIAFHSHKRAGWQGNILYPNLKQNEENTLSGRGRLRIFLTDHITIDLSSDYNRDDTGSTGRIPTVGRVPLQLKTDQSFIKSRYALPTEIFKKLGGSTDNAANSDLGFTKRTNWGASSRLKWDGDAGVFLSIAAYRKNNFTWTEDAVGLPAFMTDQKVNSHVQEYHWQYSQEFRWLTPNNEKGAIHGILGLYSLIENTHRTETFIFPKDRSSTDQNNRTDSYAAFGEISYGLSSALEITFGARLTYEKKKMYQENIIGSHKAILLESFTVQNKGSWTDISPNLTLSYQANKNSLWYGKISRGYKSGGFQGAPATKEVARRTIEPESVWNFEIGHKTQWFEDRLRLNLAGFYSKYYDLQVVQFKTENHFGFFQTSNAASASLKGIEAEITMKPFIGAEFFASYAFLEATYDEFNDYTGRDFTGNYLRQAPRQSLSLSLLLEKNLSEGSLRFRADYRYQSKTYREPDNDITIQPAFSLMDGSFAYQPQNEAWEIMLWAKNILNERYISHIYNLGGNDYALYGTPRTYGISLTLNF